MNGAKKLDFRREDLGDLGKYTNKVFGRGNEDFKEFSDRASWLRHSGVVTCTRNLYNELGSYNIRA